MNTTSSIAFGRDQTHHDNKRMKSICLLRMAHNQNSVNCKANLIAHMTSWVCACKLRRWRSTQPEETHWIRTNAGRPSQLQAMDPFNILPKIYPLLCFPSSALPRSTSRKSSQVCNVNFNPSHSVRRHCHLNVHMSNHCLCLLLYLYQSLHEIIYVSWSIYTRDHDCFPFKSSIQRIDELRIPRTVGHTTMAVESINASFANSWESSLSTFGRRNVLETWDLHSRVITFSRAGYDNQYRTSMLWELGAPTSTVTHQLPSNARVNAGY